MMQLSLGPINRIILLGGGPLLLEIAREAKTLNFNVAVITSPRHAKEFIDQKQNQHFSGFLMNLGVDFLVVDKIESNDVKRMVQDITGTLALSFGAAWIFSSRVIHDVFQERLYNVHGTRLPQNRGGGGFSWQILTGNRFGFSLIHRVDVGVDTGSIIAYNEFLYPHSCRTPAEYDSYYQIQVRDFILSFLRSIQFQSKNFSLMLQPEYLSSYWPRLHSPTHGWLDWDWEASQLERFICAFDDPYPGSSTMWNGKTIRIKSASLNLQDGIFHPAQAGLIYRTSAKWICVACKEGALVIERLLDETGCNILSEVRVGDAFVTPADKLCRFVRRSTYLPSSSEPRFRA